MRARVIALLCVGAGVLSCSKDPGENGDGVSADVSIDVSTDYHDTWAAFAAILNDAGYTVPRGRDAPSMVGMTGLVVEHKDGTKLSISLVEGKDVKRRH